MKKLLKRTTSENFKYEDNKVIRVSYSCSESYTYDSEQERTIHVREMEHCQWVDSGQVKENFGTIHEPEYKWFALFTKTKFNLEKRF